ncbi:MAG: efflux RND transporter periplasmic adaptor subunit [Anaerolineales bacterium]
MSVPATRRRSRVWLVIVVVILLALAGVAYAVYTGRLSLTPRAAPIETGQVTTITAVSSVEGTGPVTAQQSASVFWKTTGSVAEVLVQPGAAVKAGDVLMRLAPLSAPSSVIQAASELLSAQTALDDLLHPTDLAIAQAEQAVVTAQDTLDQANRNLRNVQNPAGQTLTDTVNSAKLALDTAKNNALLATVSADAQALQQATANTNITFSNYQHLQALWDAGDHSDGLFRALTAAQSAYQQALDQKTQLELRISTDSANRNAEVKNAQKKYDDAVANLNAALRGPDASKLATAEAAARVAEAALADAKDKLDRLRNGADPKDIQAAQTRIQAAQATVDTLNLVAPFDGDVLVVHYQPGDSVALTLPAIELANRSRYHLDVAVDEAEVDRITLADPATVTFSSLPGLTISGTVAAINPVGATVQGLVKYTVRIDIGQADPRVLLGMTADISIVTNTEQNALAVPLDAVQLDTDGEFVNRVNSLGAVERVPVVSGAVQDELVIVKGNLKPGDVVQLIKPVPTSNGGPFG